VPVSIADLFISVGADVSAAQSGLTSIGNQLDRTANQFQAAAPAALVLSAAGAAVAAGFGSAVTVAASFEQAMANVRAVMSPAEATQFGGALGDLAVQLGQQTVFSAREAAAGIGELIRAGVSAPDVLNGAGAAALNLAAATGISVANAATVAAQTMNAFHKSASELTGVVDTLGGVSNATAANMSDLQFGLQVVSATAQTMGLSFEDTATAIGVFVQAGETGATAGTGLRQMLLELMPTTKPARAEMEKLGLATKDGSNAFFDQAGHVKNLAGISEVLQNALKGMSDQQRIAALNTLFTRDAINSAAILASNGAKGINDWTDAISSISAADTAAIRLGTLQGALNNLGSSFETVQIIVGNLFLPVITQIAATVRGLIDQFSNLPGPVQRAVVIFVGLAGAVATLLGGIVLLAPVISAIGPAFAALGSVLAVVAPAFLAVAAVAGVLFAAWQANLFGLRQLVQRAFGAIPGVLDRVDSAFSQAGTLWENSILPAIQTIGNQIERTLIPVFNDVFPVVLDLWNKIGPILANLGLVFQKIFAGDIGGALDTFRAIIVAVAPITAGFVDLVGRIAEAVGQFSGNLGAGLVAFFRDNLPIVASAALSFAGTVGEGLTTFFTVTLPPVLAQIAAFTTDLTAPLVQFFQEHVPAIIDGAGKFAGDIGTGMVTFFTVTLPQIIAQAQGITPATFAPLVDFFETQTPIVIAGVERFGGAPIQPLVDFFNNFGEIQRQVQSLEPLFAAIGNFANALGELNTAVFNLQSTAVNTSLGPLGDALKTFVATVEPLQPAVSAIGTTLGTLGTVLQPVTDVINNAATAVRTLAQAIDQLSKAPTLTLPSIPGFGGPPAAAGQNTGTQFQRTAFTPGGANNGAAVIVNFNAPIDISGAGGLDDFIQSVAVAVAQSVHRVTAPPDNTGIPSLQTSFV
jgi:TP901 family phage tail tape measure protein